MATGISARIETCCLRRGIGIFKVFVGELASSRGSLLSGPDSFDKKERKSSIVDRM